MLFAAHFLMPRKTSITKKAALWTVYIVRCANGSLYTGITNNLASRIADHNAGRGAKYTAAFGPVVVVWKKRKKDRSAASVLEAAIKKLSRKEKDSLINK